MELTQKLIDKMKNNITQYQHMDVELTEAFDLVDKCNDTEFLHPTGFWSRYASLEYKPTIIYRLRQDYQLETDDKFVYCEIYNKSGGWAFDNDDRCYSCAYIDTAINDKCFIGFLYPDNVIRNTPGPLYCEGSSVTKANLANATIKHPTHVVFKKEGNL
jgi:hypothetical protein